MNTQAPFQDLDKARLQDALTNAITELARTTGLEINGEVIATETELDGRRADALVDINVAGQKHRYALETKPVVDRYVILGQLKNQFDELGQPGLLLAPYITAAIAKRCRELDIAFLDAVGNAYLKAPGLFVFITGRKPEGRQPDLTNRHAGVHVLRAPAARDDARTRPGVTPTALRVVFVLLCKPELLNARYRDICEAADVALGTIGWIFFDLEHRGLAVGAQEKRRFTNPTRLLDEWVTNYPIKLRPKLNAKRFRAPDPHWWKDVVLTDLGGYWGAEVAAERLTGYIRPGTQTIYLPKGGREAVTKLVMTHRLQADHEGPIEVLDTFWNLPANPAHPDVVPPLLAYADLMATAHPRKLEVARLIRERYIDNAFDQI